MLHPLSGLVVVEITDTVSAAFAGSLLADFGAEVHVVEPLPHGSAVRAKCAPGMGEQWWSSIARGKHSLPVDLAAAHAHGDAVDLLKRADVVVTDVPPHALAANPLLRHVEPGRAAPVLLHVMPTGADAPEAWRRPIDPAFAPALSGMAALTGETGGAPILPEVPLAESLAGAMAVMGLMAELAGGRLRGRRPADLSVATHQAVQRMIEWQLPVATLSGRAELRCGNNFPLNAGIANMCLTKDGKYVAISAANQPVALRLLRLVGGEEMAADPRYATPAAREKSMAHIYEVINDWVGDRTLAEILDLANRADVVIGAIWDADDILADEHLRIRESLATIVDGDGRNRPAVRTIPLAFADAGQLPAAPTLGGHDADARQDAARSRPAYGGEPGSPPLAGVIVVELGSVIAGPFAGSLLADLGATVIKVEAPGDGDSLRRMGPIVEGTSVWWGVTSRGKQCMSLDLKTDAGRQLLERLVLSADVLVENFRPGVLQRLGLGADRLRQLKPSLVMLSISGFGQTGPYARRAGFGKVAEGMSGVVSLTGQAGGRPLFVGFSLADTCTGLFGAMAVSVALYARGSGDGVHIDLALYEPLLRMLDAQLGLGRVSYRGSNDPYGWGQDGEASQAMVPCRDGRWVQLALPGRADRASAAAALGCDVDDVDASCVAGPAPKPLDLTADEACSRLAAAGIAAMPVMDALDIAGDPYFCEHGDVQWVDDPKLGRFAAPGFFPGRYGKGGRHVFRSVGIGHDNHEVLRQFLGLSDEDVDGLARQGAFGAAAPQ